MPGRTEKAYHSRVELLTESKPVSTRIICQFTNIKQEGLAMATNEAYETKQFKLSGLQGISDQLENWQSG
jgi:hypothetical protein